MNFSEVGRIIDQLSKDRGIKKSVVVKAIEQAFLVASRRKFGIQGEFEAKYNEDEDEIEIFQYKNIVETVKDGILEISHEEARVLDPECELGDQLGLRIENPNFTRVDVQTVKQIIFQKIRDAEREILFSEFKHREGELITGIARRYERGNVMVDLGKADAILPRREIIPGENFRPGDRLQAYLSEVIMTNRGPEIRLSRTSPVFLIKLFEVEVPEIQDGAIEIKAAAREPGQRAKLAVFSTDKDIDPVGACVGLKGGRVQNVVNELQGEKIDIVKWSDELEVFARASLAPAEITSISLRSDETMDVIVEEDQLSLAIGRRGQNVRLAAMLAGMKVNIISKSKLQAKIKGAVENLQQVSIIGDALAQVFVHAGIMSLAELVEQGPYELSKLAESSEEEAQRYIDEVRKALEDENILPAPKDEEEVVSASAVPGVSGFIKNNADRSENRGEHEKDKFSEAERRLREELAAFKLK